MHRSLQEIFNSHFDDYAAQHALHPRESRAAWCIRHCYTAACGSHVLRCPAGCFEQLQLHACHHRSCPRCCDAPRQHWIDAQLQRLLPCPHFHVVFTLPHELLPLWSFNRTALTQLLFDSVRLSLLELLADPRHLGAMPGILMALHTWGRTLSRHPHVHALVSAGGLSPDQSWRATRGSFLLPLVPLRRLFSCKLLAGLRQLLNSHHLALPPQQPLPHWRACLCHLYRKHWNVQINPPYPNGRGVALYLARYLKGGPLPRQRRLLDSNGLISFDYTDHHDGASHTLRLPASEFIERVLWHAPPARLHTVRHAGLYASSHLLHHRLAAAALAQQSSWPHAHPPSNPPPACTALSTPPQLCPVCRRPLLRLALPTPPTPPPPHHNSEIYRHHPPTRAPPSPALGPTQRSNGHSKAGVSRAPPPRPIVGSARLTPAFERRSTLR